MRWATVKPTLPGIAGVRGGSIPVCEWTWALHLGLERRCDSQLHQESGEGVRLVSAHSSLLLLVGRN